MEYFHVHGTLFAMSDKRKHIKNPYVETKKKEAWNKAIKTVSKQVEEEAY